MTQKLVVVPMNKIGRNSNNLEKSTPFLYHFSVLVRKGKRDIIFESLYIVNQNGLGCCNSRGRVPILEWRSGRGSKEREKSYIRDEP